MRCPGELKYRENLDQPWVCLARGLDVGRAMHRALATGARSVPDGPESLIRLFDDIEACPDWMAPAEVERGARVFHRRGAAGRAAALRVRIMRVFVRRRLASHAEWDADAWDVPISQADALLTLMGVRPRWYPASIRDASQLSFVMWVKSAHLAGEDGRAPCRAYANAFAPRDDAALTRRLRDAVNHRVHLGYTRFFLPGGSSRLDAPADRTIRRSRDRWFTRHNRGRKTDDRPVERFTR